MVVLATAELLESGRPTTDGQVDVHVVLKRHTLPYQKLTLSIGTAKSKTLAYAPVGKHHAVTGNLAGARIAMQGIPHIPRTSWSTGKQRHLTIRGDHPLGDLLDHLVHPFKKALRRHCSLPSTRKSINHRKGDRHLCGGLWQVS